MSEGSQANHVGGIPSWILSGAAVALLGGALWWGTREPTPQAAPASASQTQGAPAGQAAPRVPDGDEPSGEVATAEALLQRAIELEAAKDFAGAMALAQQSAASGGGSRALLLQAKILILQGQHDAAQAPLLQILASEPGNADAHYNLGLTWQQGSRPNYNNARNAYLAALKAEPRYAAARYNLAVLCIEHGVLDEASHHAQSFAKEFPQDARGANLDLLVAAAAKSAVPANDGE